MKKGQAALEYLMTYGWAILVVIVVVAALYAMGVFRVPGAPVPCSPCFSKFAFRGYAQVGPSYAGTNQGGALKVTSGAEEIRIDSISQSPANYNLALRIGGTVVTPPTTISPGTEIEFINITNSTGTTVTLSVGYTVTATGYSYSDTATNRNS